MRIAERHGIIPDKVFPVILQGIAGELRERYGLNAIRGDEDRVENQDVILTPGGRSLRIAGILHPLGGSDMRGGVAEDDLKVDVIVLAAGNLIIINLTQHMNQHRIVAVHHQIDLMHEAYGPIAIAGQGSQGVLDLGIIGHELQRFFRHIIEQFEHVALGKIDPVIQGPGSSGFHGRALLNEFRVGEPAVIIEGLEHLIVDTHDRKVLISFGYEVEIDQILGENGNFLILRSTDGIVTLADLGHKVVHGLFRNVSGSRSRSNIVAVVVLLITGCQQTAGRQYQHDHYSFK